MQMVRQLLTHNRDFALLAWPDRQPARRLVQLGGDTRCCSISRSAKAVAVLMVMQILPIALVGPTAGVVADRYDCRRP